MTQHITSKTDNWCIWVVPYAIRWSDSWARNCNEMEKLYTESIQENVMETAFWCLVITCLVPTSVKYVAETCFKQEQWFASKVVTLNSPYGSSTITWLIAQFQSSRRKRLINFERRKEIREREETKTKPEGEVEKEERSWGKQSKWGKEKSQRCDLWHLYRHLLLLLVAVEIRVSDSPTVKTKLDPRIFLMISFSNILETHCKNRFCKIFIIFFFSKLWHFYKEKKNIWSCDI